MNKVQGYCIMLLFCVSLHLHAQVPDWQWARAIYTDGQELARDVAADTVTGNIYIAGTWRNDLSAFFSGNSYPSTDFSITYGQEDGLVVKYDQNGTILWAFKIGGTGEDEASAITLDSSGNIYLTGYINEGTNYFSGTSSSTPDSTITNPSGLDFFVAKYNPDGTLLWVRHSDGSSGDAKGLGIYAENSSIFASGYCTGSTSFGPFSGSFNQGNEDFFVAKYDLNGSEQWLLEGGSDESDFAHNVLSDGTNVYSVGSFTGTTLSVLDTSGTNVVSMANASSGNSEVFILSFDVNSNYNWGQKISSIENDDGYGITHDTDSLYITGGISNSANFPDYINNPVTVSSNKDIFISSHSKTNGNTGWVRVVTCTNNGDEEGLDIITDISQSIYITGFFSQDINFFGDTTITSTGNDDIFVASFLDNGTFNWAKMAGSVGGMDIGCGISTDNLTNIYIAGHYNEQAFFDNDTLPGYSGRNIFLANIELDTCINAEGGTASTALDHICLSESTTISLTGYYGMIQWQSSLYGLNNWTDISGENAPTLVVSPNDTTDYRAFLTSDPCQPDSSNTITVYVDLQPAANAGTDAEICISDGSYTIIGSTSSNGTILWTTSGDGSFDVAGGENPTYTIGSETGSVTLTKTVSSPGSCADAVDFMVLTLTPEPTSDAGAGGDECDLDYALQVTPGVGTGTWTKTSGPGTETFTPDATTPDATVTVDAYGTYEFTWTEVNGICSDDSTIIVHFYEPPIADAGQDVSLCFGEESQLNASGGITYSWSPETGLSNSNIPNPVASPNLTTTFTVTLTDQNGCENFDELTVVVHKHPTANAGPDQELDYVFETTMEAELNSSESGEWSVVSGSGEFSNKNSPVSMVTGLSVGDNIFTWKVTNGVCPEAADEVKITVSDFLAPSVITPNGDNKNDYFVVRGIRNFDSSELNIFNRWGAEVYKNNMYQNNWDGRDHNGNELPADTYFYVIKLFDGRVLKGFVVIKR